MSLVYLYVSNWRHSEGLYWVQWVMDSEAVKEVMLIVQLLQRIKVVVKVPYHSKGKYCGDNFYDRQEIHHHHKFHQACRYYVKYVIEYIDDEIIKKLFIKSAENDINILTKNFSGEMQETHLRKIG